MKSGWLLCNEVNWADLLISGSVNIANLPSEISRNIPSAKYASRNISVAVLRID